MSRVVFSWVRWKAPQLTPDALAHYVDRAEKTGVSGIVRTCVPMRKEMLVAATVGVIGGAILGSYSNVANNSDVARFCGIIGGTLFAWGLLQLPIYFVSVLIARSECASWLREI